jgi:tetratricopeptide (TPR) repeat protein
MLRRCFQLTTLSVGLFAFSISTSSIEVNSGDTVRDAIQLAAQRQCSEAAQLLKGIDESSQPAALAFYGVAECYMKRSEWKKAESFLDAFLRLSPKDTSGLFLKSYLLFRTSRYEQSLRLISSYIQQQPNNSDAHKILGMDYYMVGKQEEAELELKRAIELSVTDPEAFYYLGRLYFTRNEMPAAVSAFQKAIQLDSSSVRAQNHLGQALEGLGEYESARKVYLKAIELEKEQQAKSRWPYYNLGSLYLKQGQFPEAIDYLRQSLGYNPSWTEGKLKLAKALLGSGDIAASELLLREVLASEPQNATAHYQLARLLTKIGDREQAAKHYQQFEKLKKP